MPESQPAADYTKGTVEITCNSNNSSRKFKVFLIATGESPSCSTTMGSCPTLQNNVSTYSTTYKISVEPNSNISDYKIRYKKNSNWCTDKCGEQAAQGACHSSPIQSDEEVTLTSSNPSFTFDVSRTSDSNIACGSYQTDVWILNIENCESPSPADYSNPYAGTLGWGLCYTGMDCPTTLPTPVFTNTCNLSFTLGVATPTPTAVSSLTPTPTATATATATATPNSCNGSCGSNSNCGSDYFCYQGYCRNASCPTESDCSCGTSTPGATGTPRQVVTNPQEPSLPNAGISAPTIISMGAGVILLVLSLILAL